MFGLDSAKGPEAEGMGFDFEFLVWMGGIFEPGGDWFDKDGLIMPHKPGFMRGNDFSGLGHNFSFQVIQARSNDLRPFIGHLVGLYCSFLFGENLPFVSFNIGFKIAGPATDTIPGYLFQFPQVTLLIRIPELGLST